MNKFRFFKRLAFQTSFYFLMTTMLAILIASTMLYTTISSIVMEQSLDHTKSSVINSGRYVDSYLNKLESISAGLANNPQIKRYIACCDEEDEGLKLDVLNLIDNNLLADDFFRSITIIVKDGRILSNEENLDMAVSKDMMEQEWYMDAVACSGIPILTGARMTDITMNKDEWVISMAREIKDINGYHLGVVLIDIDYRAIDEYISRANLGDSGYAFILDNENNLVFHNDSSYFGDDDKLKQLIKVSQMPLGYDKKSNTLIHKYSFNNDNWVLYGVASLDELASIQKRMLNIFILTAALLLLIVTGIGIIMSRRITKPISVLEKRMSDFNKEFSLLTVDKTSCFEAQSLTLQFNEMITTIKKLMDEVKQNEKSLRIYELNVLRSQINPHFLYNTLDTIIWMAEYKDHEKVISITKALASFFRLSLREGKELTTIKDELNHIEQYLFIQKQRYENMEYSIVSEKNIGKIEVPKIILQPIVENAIYHGIKGLTGIGKIDIEVKINEGFIIFTIDDNGVGFNVDKIHTDKDTKIKLGGVGIRNVDQRIKLQYGKDSGVFIESTIGRGTSVQIKIAVL